MSGSIDFDGDGTYLRSNDTVLSVEEFVDIVKICQMLVEFIEESELSEQWEEYKTFRKLKDK